MQACAVARGVETDVPGTLRVRGGLGSGEASSTMTTARGQEYRAEIDGLRAVAVLLVLAYHLDFGVTGGFVGVDVFFVISGYLITWQIVSEHEQNGAFSISAFYARRARRILPALFLTLALTGVASFLTLSPEALRDVGGSMMAATASVANVFFWMASGYFEAEARARPLLHTWSLGVEEQLYVLWPLLIVLLLRRSRRLALAGVAVVTALSLLSGEVLRRVPLGVLALVPGGLRMYEEPTHAAFFLTPFRVWELGAGALLVWMHPIQRVRRNLDELLAAAGLLAIGVAALRYTSDTEFPGLGAVLPVGGAMLAVFGGRSQWLGSALRSRVAVTVGKASYSIYLLHWPLLVLTEQYVLDDLSMVQRGAVGLVALLAGLASYRWVEQPWRTGPASRWPAARLAIVCGGSAAALSILGAWVWTGNGLSWRVPVRRQSLTSQEWRAAERSFCRSWRAGLDRTLSPCQNDRGAARTIFLWGDSHALHLVPGISEAFPDHNVFAFYKPGCLPVNGLGLEDRVGTQAATDACRQQNQAALRVLLDQAPSVVVLSASKRGAPAQVAAATSALRGTLRGAGHEVIVLGDFIRPGKWLVWCRAVPDWVIGDGLVSRRCEPRASVVAREMRYSTTFLAGVPGAVDVRPVQCPDGSCRFFDGDGTPLFRDSHHLNVLGSRIFLAALHERLGMVIRTEGLADASTSGGDVARWTTPPGD